MGDLRLGEGRRRDRKHARRPLEGGHGPSRPLRRRALDGYFPGPDRWPRARAHVALPGQLTSGITNPPFLVSAALRTGRLQRDARRRHAFWRRCFPPLRDWLGYLSTSRLLPQAPLVAVVHPWESGWDNSPRWDHLRDTGLKPLLRYARLDNRQVEAADRPSDRDYDGYMALVELLDGVDYRLHAYRERSPFCVYDVLVDALFYRAAVDLNEMAAELGEPLPLSPAWLSEFAAAFEELHWDAELELYVDWDCVAGSRIRRHTAAGLAALAGGAARPDRARRAWERYRQEAGGALPVCTVPPSDPAFDPTRYWRGPVWVNVNWLIAEGIEQAGLAGDAAELRAQTLEMVRREGFGEYLDPRVGRARGAQDFSWTAALTLDLLAAEPP
ncbi:trehalase family glycosidase [Candidatus Nephthysia bennettiae]|uniref:Neutral trehalase n=1 Tax=Candidatus Nephthysia bennettiae TaxID=3127016 RepID=A0A934K443_9BACT|nr:neutral trehalase [Candidatus Dormibacteraeota bacterium]MBJ7611334.1 neutral trehalase [Candidatus Dormibacteraeota bacterium]